MFHHFGSKWNFSMGDYILAGKQSGKVKAIFNERGVNLDKVPPATPVSILGLDGHLKLVTTFFSFK